MIQTIKRREETCTWQVHLLALDLAMLAFIFGLCFVHETNYLLLFHKKLNYYREREQLIVKHYCRHCGACILELAMSTV